MEDMDIHDCIDFGLHRRMHRYCHLSPSSQKIELTETGYVGRIMLHHNPWDGNGFDIQICCLIIAPAFIAAGIYLNLKHIVLEVGPSFSHLRPKFYTWIFILCDLFSLILQGTGGGIAATADDGSSFQKVGNDLMMAGIVWQVITLLLFGTLVADYAFRTFKNRANLAPSAVILMATLRWKLLIVSLTLAFVTVFTRCIFRIGEMAKGWANPIMRDETDFIVLDGVMMTISTLCLTIFHPGYTFPEMQMHGKTSPVGEFSSAEKNMVHDEESTSASLDRSGPVKEEPSRGLAQGC